MAGGEAEWEEMDLMMREYFQSEARDILRKLTRKVLDAPAPGALLDHLGGHFDHITPAERLQLFVILDSIGQMAAKSSRHAQSLEQLGELIRGPMARAVRSPSCKPHYPRIEKMITIWKAKDVFPPHVIRAVNEAMEGIVPSSAPSLDGNEESIPPITVCCRKIRTPADVERVLRKMEEIRRQQKQFQYETELRQAGEEDWAEMDELRVREELRRKQRERKQRQSHHGTMPLAATTRIEQLVRSPTLGDSARVLVRGPAPLARVSGKKRSKPSPEMYSPWEELQVKAQQQPPPPPHRTQPEQEMYSPWEVLQPRQRAAEDRPIELEPHRLIEDLAPPRQEGPPRVKQEIRFIPRAESHGHRSRGTYPPHPPLIQPNPTQSQPNGGRDWSAFEYATRDRGPEGGQSSTPYRDRSAPSHGGYHRHERDRSPRGGREGGRSNGAAHRSHGPPSRASYHERSHRGGRSHHGKEKEPYNWELPERAKRRT